LLSYPSCSLPPPEENAGIETAMDKIYVAVIVGSNINSMWQKRMNGAALNWLDLDI
jgi:hypothetical protein